jgi:hypothetical protein
MSSKSDELPFSDDFRFQCPYCLGKNVESTEKFQTKKTNESGDKIRGENLCLSEECSEAYIWTSEDVEKRTNPEL